MNKRSKQQELSKRGAAALARTTIGLSKTVPNEKVYRRSKSKEQVRSTVRDDLTFEDIECLFDEWRQEDKLLREIGEID